MDSTRAPCTDRRDRGAFVSPSRTLSIRRSECLVAFLGGLAALLYSGAINFSGRPFEHHWPDSQNYLAMAQGLLEQATAPFTSRILVPVTAGTIHRTIGADLDLSFFLVSAVAACIFFFFSARMLTAHGVGGVISAALLLIPPTLIPFRDIYLPDAASMAWTALALLIMLGRRPFLLPAVMLAGALTREAAIVLLLVSVWLLLRSGRRVLAASTVAAAVAGLAIVHLYGGQSNAHGMNGALYLLLKPPVLFVENMLGAEFWVGGASRIACARPAIVLDLGSLPLLGHLEQVGLCAPSYKRLIITYSALFSLFGVLPGALLGIVGSRWGQFRDRCPWIFAVIVLGLAMFLMGVVTGRAVERLLIYSWPAFVIGVGVAWAEVGRPHPFAWPVLLTIHAATSWVVFAHDNLIGWDLRPRALVLGLGLLGNVLSYLAFSPHTRIGRLVRPSAPGRHT